MWTTYNYNKGRLLRPNATFLCDIFMRHFHGPLLCEKALTTGVRNKCTQVHSLGLLFLLSTVGIPTRSRTFGKSKTWRNVLQVGAISRKLGSPPQGKSTTNTTAIAYGAFSLLLTALESQCLCPKC